MSKESDFRLSFYRDIKPIDTEHNVMLVEGIEDKVLYVKKLITAFDRDVYDVIAQNCFPHIPAIRELIPGEEGMTVIEEYINGRNIESILDERLFTEEETRGIAGQLCEILKPLHEHNPKIIHRDIKPSNLILTAGGVLYLVDFNASKDYEPGKHRDTVLMGTAEYAAPEQYGFSQSNERTDIYSIGVLMNKMLTGRFPAEEIYEGRLTAVIKKCLSMDPDRRYHSVEALSAAVTKKYDKWSWMIPGFRTKKPWKMGLAVTWYVFWIGIIHDIKVKDGNDNYYTGGMQILVELMLWLIIFGTTFYLADYHGFRDHFPFRKSENKWLEVLRVSLGCMIIIVTPVIMVAVIDPTY